MRATSSFIVRDDDGALAILCSRPPTRRGRPTTSTAETACTTGGPADPARAYKVSYNRPFTTRGTAPRTGSSTPSTRWSAGSRRNGYNVSYFTGVDSDRRGSELLEHKVFLSVGHDEYWSAASEPTSRRARRRRQPRVLQRQRGLLEDALGAEHRRHRHAAPHARLLQGDARRARRSIRIPRGPAPGATRASARQRTAASRERAHGNDLHRQLLAPTAIQVPAEDGQDALLAQHERRDPARRADRDARRTARSATSGTRTSTMAPGRRACSGCRRRRVNVPQRSSDHGSTYGPGTATHSLTLYRTRAARWSSAPAPSSGRGGSTASTTAAADARTSGCSRRPSTCSPTWASSRRLCRPVSSRRRRRPTPPRRPRTITSPADGANVATGSPVTITGTATDTGGGVVGGVEVSTDGGSTWHRATGRASWTLLVDARRPARLTIQSRAVDDSGNLETPGRRRHRDGRRPRPARARSGTTRSTPARQSANDTTAGRARRQVPVGRRRLHHRRSGSTRGRRTPARTSAHLWTNAGTLLATATFTGETASGWQQATFASADRRSPRIRRMSPRTTPPAGWYAADGNYFASRVRQRAAPCAGGRRRRAQRRLPLRRRRRSRRTPSTRRNYWVDVVFDTTAAPDTTPPTVVSVTPAAGATGSHAQANLTATFNEAMDAATITSATFELRDAANALVPAAVTYDAATLKATLNPTPTLAFSTGYTATVSGGAGASRTRPGTRSRRLTCGRSRRRGRRRRRPTRDREDPSSSSPEPTRSAATTPRSCGRRASTPSTCRRLSTVTPRRSPSYDVVILGDMPLTRRPGRRCSRTGSRPAAT